MFKWVKGKFLQFIAWMMKIKSVAKMVTVVICIFALGWFVGKKDLNINTFVKMYKEFIAVEKVIADELEEATPDSTDVPNE